MILVGGKICFVGCTYFVILFGNSVIGFYFHVVSLSSGRVELAKSLMERWRNGRKDLQNVF